MERLFYLSVVLLLLLSTSAVATGVSYATIIGKITPFSEEKNISFEIYADSYYRDSYTQKTIDGDFAMTVTFPPGYSRVTLKPLVNGVLMDVEFEIVAGETKEVQIDTVFPENFKASTKSTIAIENKENQKKISDLKKEITIPYDGEITIRDVPKVEKKNPSRVEYPANTIKSDKYPMWVVILTNPFLIAGIIIGYLVLLTQQLRKR